MSAETYLWSDPSISYMSAVDTNSGYVEYTVVYDVLIVIMLSIMTSQLLHIFITLQHFV